MTKSRTRMKSFGQLSAALRDYWTSMEHEAERDPMGLQRYAGERASALVTPFTGSSRRD